MRFAELAVFVAPILAFLLWRFAIARGLDGPPPAQLLVVLAALMIFGGGLVYYAERDRLPPGRYIPAQFVNGHIVRGHTQ